MSSISSVNKTKKRQANYDLLRIISTIAVILIHVNWKYFGSSYAESQLTLTWIGEAFINIITRFSVPCFVMLSGAFILQNANNGNAVAFYKKSIKKIFVPTFLAIVLFFFCQLGIDIKLHRPLWRGLLGIITGGFYNLWYIYMLSGLYFLAPYIIKLKTVIAWKQYETLAWIMLTWAVVSQALSSQKAAYCIGVCFAFLAYFLIGDVLKEKIQRGGIIIKQNF